MITIKDMAEKLGISTTTVSNVIHGKTSQVSPQTIQKVQTMLKEYDYIPNINARNLAQNHSSIIGVVLKSQKGKYDNVLADPFMGELIGAIEKEVRKKGYFFMIYISDEISEIIQSVSSWNADGLILVGLQNDDYIKLKRKYSKPMVLIDSYATKDVSGYINIGLDDAQGSYEITNHLIENGHKHIAFISDNLTGVDYYRYLGFQKALKDHNLESSTYNLIIILTGAKALESSLQKLYAQSSKYTAFLCASDYYAVIVMNYLQDHGIKVPQDMSIAGFDDNIMSRLCRPTLTTIHQDVTQKGEVSVATLISIIENNVLSTKNIHLPVHLVKRNSVKNISL